MLTAADGTPALAEYITKSNVLEDIEPGLDYWSVMASDCAWSLRSPSEE